MAKKKGKKKDKGKKKGRAAQDEEIVSALAGAAFYLLTEL